MPPSRYFRGCIQSALHLEANSGRLGIWLLGACSGSTHHDANVIAALVQFPVSERTKERLASLEEEDARLVGEILVGIRDYSSVSPEVQATVDRYRDWVKNNRRLRLQR